MSVTDYIQKKEEGDQKNDTLIHKVMEAYVSLGKTITGDDGLVETEKLKDKEVRKAATSAIYRATLKIMKKGLVLKLSLLMPSARPL